MFKISLDIYLCYIIYYKNIAIKSQYLKLIFKNERSKINIQKAIILN